MRSFRRKAAPKLSRPLPSSDNVAGSGVDVTVTVPASTSPTLPKSVPHIAVLHVPPTRLNVPGNGAPVVSVYVPSGKLGMAKLISKMAESPPGSAIVTWIASGGGNGVKRPDTLSVAKLIGPLILLTDAVPGTADCNVLSHTNEAVPVSTQGPPQAEGEPVIEISMLTRTVSSARMVLGPTSVSKPNAATAYFVVFMVSPRIPITSVRHTSNFLEARKRPNLSAVETNDLRETCRIRCARVCSLFAALFRGRRFRIYKRLESRRISSESPVPNLQ